MIKVTNMIEAKEVSGKDPVIGKAPVLCVKSHNNHASYVVLSFYPSDTEFTFLASDLEAAIRNACNSNRHGS